MPESFLHKLKMCLSVASRKMTYTIVRLTCLVVFSAECILTGFIYRSVYAIIKPLRDYIFADIGHSRKSPPQSGMLRIMSSFFFCFPKVA